MTETNAFVLNLDSDTVRMQHFWDMNQNATIKIQRFSAFGWQPSPKKALQWRRLSNQQQQQDDEIITPQQQALLDEQAKWAKQYPWLTSRRARNGEKGCSLSHIRLLHDFVLKYQNYTTTTNDTNASPSSGTNNKSQDDWYRFVFEDDAKLMEPLLSQGSVTAPADADVVFLSRGVTRAVKVPYYHRQDVEKKNLLALTTTSSSSYHYRDYAVRVISGFGTQGYIITLRGAKKFLHCLSTYSQPVDIVLLGSCSSLLRIYLPALTTTSTTTSTTSPSTSSWLSLYKPQVMHDNRHSTITSHS
jgi:GR25 family glycosyltransferase involved in LPS biosynthesis